MGGVFGIMKGSKATNHFAWLEVEMVCGIVQGSNDTDRIMGGKRTGVLNIAIFYYMNEKRWNGVVEGSKGTNRLYKRDGKCLEAYFNSELNKSSCVIQNISH